ncbi:MAG TPA: PilZ domain-containing protein [Candidatus Angelobacter sp.]|nr:PilZ domain-containing protein [Candidatus Angelobacter sp.]
MSSLHAENSTIYSGWKANLRRSPRSPINMHVKIFRTMDGERKLIPGYARNIGEEGMAAFIPAQLLTDEGLEVQFTLPGSDQQLTIQATVRTIDRLQYGLEFTRFDHMTRNIIARHCRAPQPAGSALDQHISH